MQYDDLRALDELREKGSITEEEYQREKAKLMSETNHTSSTGNNSAKQPLWGLAENTFLLLIHLSQFAGAIVPLAGFVLPIIMWVTQKDVNANVDLHGKNILNAIISYTIYALVLSITIIGIPLAIILGVIYVVFVILAAIKANNGEYWKYPFTIQFVK